MKFVKLFPPGLWLTANSIWIAIEVIPAMIFSKPFIPLVIWLGVGLPLLFIPMFLYSNIEGFGEDPK